MIRVQAVARCQPLPTWIVSVVVSISLTVTCTTTEEIRFPEIEITANLALTAVSGEPSFGTGGDTVQRPGRQQHHSLFYSRRQAAWWTARLLRLNQQGQWLTLQGCCDIA
jgi:hypothetical protein